MRRVAGVLALATLVAGASGLALTGSAGSAVNYPILKVKKVVTGTSTAGFTVTVSCITPTEVTAQAPLSPDTLTFLADGTPNTSSNGSWVSVAGNWQFQNSSLVGDTCTVTETVNGGATAASYACEFVDGIGLGSVSPQFTGAGCSGSASGPSVVTFAESCGVDTSCAEGSSALVTITNTFPAITVGPTASVPGGTVTISGTECNVGGTPFPFDVNPAAVGGIVTGTVAFTPPVSFGPVTAAPDGAWSTTVVVPAGTLPGSYAVNATCTEPAGTAEVSAQAVNFTYPTRFVTIAVAAAPKFAG